MGQTTFSPEQQAIIDEALASQGGGGSTTTAPTPTPPAPVKPAVKFTPDQQAIVDEALASQSSTPQGKTWGDTANDAVIALGSGVAKGALGFLDAPGSIANLWKMGVEKAGEATGVPKTVTDAITMEEYQEPYFRQKAEGISPKIKEYLNYEPETQAGKYMGTGGEFATSMFGGPGSLATKALTRVAAPAILSETAGQASEGTDAEPWMRLIGALGGAGLGAASERAFSGLTKKGAEAAAALKIAAATKDPKAALAALRRDKVELVPGSKPTFAELTGDTRLAATQKRMLNRDPEFKEDLTDLHTSNAEARQRALAALRPDQADVLGAADALKSRAAAVEASGAANVARLTGEAKTAADAVAPTGNKIEEIGDSYRKLVTTEKDRLRTDIGDLYTSVDPNKSLSIVTSPVRDAAKSARSEMTDLTAPLEGEAGKIFSIAENMPDTKNFTALIDFKKRINAAISAEKMTVGKNSPAIYYLNKIRSGIEDALENAMDNQSRWVTPKGYTGPQPNMTPGAAGRLATANKNYADFGDTYHTSHIQAITSPSKTSGYGYNVLPGNVPSRVFSAGNAGYTTTKDFLKAAGNTVEAVNGVKEIALNSLRQMSGEAKTLSADIVGKWKTKYEPAIRAIKEADPDFELRIDGAVGKDTAALAGAAAAKAANEAVAIGRAKKLLGASSEDEVRGIVSSSLGSESGKREIDELLGSVAGDTAAIDGIKAAGVDGMLGKYGNGARLGAFVRDKRGAIEALYGKPGYYILSSIAKDVERAAEAVRKAAVKGSDTAANTMDVLRELSNKTGDLNLGTFITLGLTGHAMYGNVGAAAGSAAALAGTKLLSALRNKGIDNTNKLVKQAMINPEFGKKMLELGIKSGKLQASGIEGLIKIINSITSSGAASPPTKAYGGAVGIDHKFEARQLMKAAEAARKNLGEMTEPLLNQSDESIGKALEVANRSI
jgi:hypothetical protein